MSAACKRIALVFCLAWPLLLFADDDVSPPECADDVCVVNVISEKLITAPCKGYSVLAAYSKSSGATLIQCSKPNAEENKALIYDRHNFKAKSFEFDGGRFIRPDFLATAGAQGIPDKFGPVRLCPAQNREAAAAGQLLIAEKQPSASESDPYCYRIHYIVAGKDSLKVHGDDGKELAPLSDKAGGEWTPLREKLSHYIGAKHAAAAKLVPRKQVRSAFVTSDKAQLFLSPDPAAPSKMYLVKGDKVRVVDDRKPVSGWCLVRYVTKAGKSVQRWVQQRDLDSPRM